MASLPKRCKSYSVGKEIGGAVYVHRLYEELLPASVRLASKLVPTGFDYTVVKFVEKTHAVSFALCPDFDLAEEPVVGDILRIDSNGKKQYFRQQADPFIYHHKWLFVMDDYKGFDVQMSRSRSIEWLGLKGVDAKRIGRKSFWDAQIAPRLNSTHERWFTSIEMSKHLQVTACELCHMRIAGRLRFAKLGNAYFYVKEA